ncbi:unnamed protein product [Amoebophrya sp. A120]|nr:unnamed protein product [Amoebophrya sp. A120]|eukprot:GSA120T00013915001.1
MPTDLNPSAAYLRQLVPGGRVLLPGALLLTCLSISQLFTPSSNYPCAVAEARRFAKEKKQEKKKRTRRQRKLREEQHQRHEKKKHQRGKRNKSANSQLDDSELRKEDGAISAGEGDSSLLFGAAGGRGSSQLLQPDVESRPLGEDGKPFIGPLLPPSTEGSTRDWNTSSRPVGVDGKPFIGPLLPVPGGPGASPQTEAGGNDVKEPQDPLQSAQGSQEGDPIRAQPHTTTLGADDTEPTRTVVSASPSSFPTPASSAPFFPADTLPTPAEELQTLANEEPKAQGVIEESYTPITDEQGNVIGHSKSTTVFMVGGSDSTGMSPLLPTGGGPALQLLDPVLKMPSGLFSGEARTAPALQAERGPLLYNPQHGGGLQLVGDPRAGAKQAAAVAQQQTRTATPPKPASTPCGGDGETSCGGFFPLDAPMEKPVAGAAANTAGGAGPGTTAAAVPEATLAQPGRAGAAGVSSPPAGSARNAPVLHPAAEPILIVDQEGGPPPAKTNAVLQVGPPAATGYQHVMLSSSSSSSAAAATTSFLQEGELEVGGKELQEQAAPLHTPPGSSRSRSSTTTASTPPTSRTSGSSLANTKTGVLAGASSFLQERGQEQESSQTSLQQTASGPPQPPSTAAPPATAEGTGASDGGNKAANEAGDAGRIHRIRPHPKSLDSCCGDPDENKSEVEEDTSTQGSPKEMKSAGGVKNLDEKQDSQTIITATPPSSSSFLATSTNTARQAITDEADEFMKQAVEQNDEDNLGGEGKNGHGNPNDPEHRRGSRSCGGGNSCGGGEADEGEGNKGRGKGEQEEPRAAGEVPEPGKEGGGGEGNAIFKTVLGREQEDGASSATSSDTANRNATASEDTKTRTSAAGATTPSAASSFLATSEGRNKMKQEPAKKKKQEASDEEEDEGGSDDGGNDEYSGGEEEEDEAAPPKKGANKGGKKGGNNKQEESEDSDPDVMYADDFLGLNSCCGGNTPVTQPPPSDEEEVDKRPSKSSAKTKKKKQPPSDEEEEGEDEEEEEDAAASTSSSSFLATTTGRKKTATARWKAKKMLKMQSKKRSHAEPEQPDAAEIAPRLPEQTAPKEEQPAEEEKQEGSSTTSASTTGGCCDSDPKSGPMDMSEEGGSAKINKSTSSTEEEAVPATEVDDDEEAAAASSSFLSATALEGEEPPSAKIFTAPSSLSDVARSAVLETITKRVKTSSLGRTSEISPADSMITAPSDDHTQEELPSSTTSVSMLSLDEELNVIAETKVPLGTSSQAQLAKENSGIVEAYAPPAASPAPAEEQKKGNTTSSVNERGFAVTNDPNDPNYDDGRFKRRKKPSCGCGDCAAACAGGEEEEKVVDKAAVTASTPTEQQQPAQTVAQPAPAATTAPSTAASFLENLHGPSFAEMKTTAVLLAAEEEGKAPAPVVVFEKRNLRGSMKKQKELLAAAAAAGAGAGEEGA